MTITNGDKVIKISRWEVCTIVGGITSAICSICNVINKNGNKKVEVKEISEQK